MDKIRKEVEEFMAKLHEKGIEVAVTYNLDLADELIGINFKIVGSVCQSTG